MLGYFELHAPGVVLHGYPFGITDRESLQAYYAEVWEACPDARLEIEDVVAGEKVVVRFTWHGTPAYGEPIAAPCLLMGVDRCHSWYLDDAAGSSPTGPATWGALRAHRVLDLDEYTFVPISARASVAAAADLGDL